MILVCLDANALHGDPLLLKQFSRRLLDHVEKGTCQVHLSPVVGAELDRMLRDELGAEHDSLVTRIKDVGGRHQTPVTDLLADLEAFRSAARRQIDARREQLAATDGFFVQPWPNCSSQEVVERELARRRPFIDKEKVGTIGHRDTIIWLGVLALAAGRPDDTIAFVTKDNGFLGGDGLHEDLQEDLINCGVELTRVERFRDVFSLVTYLDKQFKASKRTAARAAIRQALHEYNDVLIKLEWGWEFDPREGGLVEPEIDAGLPHEMENVMVTHIESPLDVKIEPDTPESGEPVRCTHEVTVSIDGAMTKSDWYSHAYPDLDLWDNDLNEHYVSVDAVRVLELTTEVLYDPEVDEAQVKDIIDVRVIPRSA
ncbi:PIN domain-containing protein [Micromonospora purpureochromogenes]|uniref:PIN domain-containing protein n=1 Tax=Micromonospora purpureochromogenes TaxID=47872 RepID=UPI0036442590